MDDTKKTKTAVDKTFVKDEVRTLDKTLNDIRETEKKAEQAVNDAHRKADTIIAKAKEEGFKLGLKKKQEIAQERDKELEAKKKTLIAKKQDTMRETCKTCLHIEQKSSKNRQKAVDLVLSTFKEKTRA